MCQHAVHLLDQGSKWCPFPMVRVASSQETALYTATGHGGPTAEDFHLDFHGALSSDWNKHAMEVFASHFFECGWYGSPNKHTIKKVFQTHLHTLHVQYMNLQADSDPDHEQLQIKHDKEKENARDQRHHSVRLSDMLQHHWANTCLAHPDLTPFKLLWKTLPHNAMSGNVSNHLPGVKWYAIMQLNWHSQMATDWLQVFDFIHLSTSKQGAFPHVWVSSCQVELSGVAVPGLPSNFYDSTWLLHLDDGDKARLNVLPEMDLSHTEAILR
ncbi:hypothetical protein F5J12DRAFT_724118 [Pisolithus orientalis]|uniref:uncharacterized protein n=1 Tax=Pisolithus orientalis TaxID=936130 RepID=UPI002223F07F|nr:uncharacterized protein F5J12DRAFT_724118 [Pisolithus orientalis]KAI6000328.1 hypothetical protein F5J12DRAFT_724118 [Pisolithus orientalis]